MDKGGKETIAKIRELGMEADSGSTNLHTGGSIAGGDRGIISGGKGHEDEAVGWCFYNSCALYL